MDLFLYPDDTTYGEHYGMLKGALFLMQSDMKNCCRYRVCRSPDYNLKTRRTIIRGGERAYSCETCLEHALCVVCGKSSCNVLRGATISAWICDSCVVSGCGIKGCSNGGYLIVCDMVLCRAHTFCHGIMDYGKYGTKEYSLYGDYRSGILIDTDGERYAMKWSCAQAIDSSHLQCMARVNGRRCYDRWIVESSDPTFEGIKLCADHYRRRNDRYIYMTDPRFDILISGIIRLSSGEEGSKMNTFSSLTQDVFNCIALCLREVDLKGLRLMDRRLKVLVDEYISHLKQVQEMMNNKDALDIGPIEFL